MTKISITPQPLLSYEDLVTKAIGELGRAQILIAIVHFIPYVLLPMSMITVSFSTGRTNWWKVSHVYNETGILLSYKKQNERLVLVPTIF